MLSRARLFVTPWTAAHQAPLSMRFSRQGYWSGLPFPSPGDLPNPGIKPRDQTQVSCSAGISFTNWATREAPYVKHMLTEMKGKLVNLKVIRDCNTPFSILNRWSRQKISKEPVKVSKTIEQINPTDIYWTFYPTAIEYIFISNTHKIFSSFDYILSHKTSPSKFKKTDIISTVFSYSNSISHEIKRCLLLGRKAMTNLNRVLKSRDIFASKDLDSQSYGFSSSHAQYITREEWWNTSRKNEEAGPK